MLSKTILSSSVWALLGSLVTQSSGFIIFIVIARYVSPEEVGVVSLAIILTEVSKQFFIAGIPDSLIKTKNWDSMLAFNAIIASITMAIVLSLIVITLSFILSLKDGYEKIPVVAITLCITLFIDSLNSLFESDLRRNFKYKAITHRMLMANSISGVLGIALAITGLNIWAIVFQKLSFSAITLAITYKKSKYKITGSFSKRRMRYIWRTASGIVGSRVVSAVNGQIVPLIIGLYLGPAQLAIYKLADQIFNLVTQVAVSPIQRVSLSALSREGNLGRAQKMLKQMLLITSFFACPLYLGVGLIAPSLIDLIFNKSWHESSSIITIITMLVAPTIINSFLTPVLTIYGNTKYAFLYYLWSGVANAILAIVALPFGLTAVAGSQVLRAYVMAVIPIKYISQATGITKNELINSVKAPLICASISFVCLYLINEEFFDAGSNIEKVGVDIILGILLYTMSFIVLFARKLSDIKSILFVWKRA